MIARVAIVLCVCVVTALSIPTKLCAPEKWTASLLGKVAQVVDGKAQVLSIRAMSYNDYTLKMESFVQMVKLNDGTIFNMTIISDINAMKTYEIYPDSKTCTVRDLPTSLAKVMKRFCAGDDDLKKVGTLTVGGKMADMYELAFHNGTQIMTVMRDNFEPVTSIIEQNFYGVPQMVAFQFGNLSADIDDMSVFKVPSYCMKSEMKRVCAPDAWESAAVGKLAQVEGGNPAVYSVEMMISYDYANKMEAITLTAEAFNSKTIIDWTKKMRYDINLDTMNCSKKSLPTPDMPEMCSDSKHLIMVDSLTVDGRMAGVYYMNVSKDYQTSLTLFSDTFEPISAVNEMKTYYKGMPIPQMLAAQYGNFTSGIADRSVFNVPAACMKSEVDKTSVVG